MYYVYILESQKDQSKYVGTTTDLQKRLVAHNSGSNKYSSGKRPLKLIWYSAFHDKEKAYDFEKYLKSGSGFAFARKRLV